MGWDKQKQHEYLRERYAKHRELLAQWLEAKGACAHCGVRDVPLEIDHIDPCQKEFSPTHGGHSMSPERLEAELAKCQALCAPCHKIKTKLEQAQGLLIKHGSRRMFKSGCRCAECASHHMRREMKKLIEEVLTWQKNSNT